MPDERQLLHEPAYGPKVTDLIRDDHQRISQILSELVNAKGGHRRRGLLIQLSEDMVRHEVAEEEVIYASLAHRSEQARLVRDARTQEETELKAALLHLNRRSLIRAGGRGFDRELKSLASLVARHGEAEESEVFDLLENDEAQSLRIMATLFGTARRVAPTRPHPHVPPRAVVLLGLGPVIGIGDRVRDLVRRFFLGKDPTN